MLESIYADEAEGNAVLKREFGLKFEPAKFRQMINTFGHLLIERDDRIAQQHVEEVEGVSFILYRFFKDKLYCF